MKDEKRHFIIGGPGDDSVVAIPVEEVRDAVQNLDAHKRRVHSEAKLLASLGFWVLPVARLEKGYPEKEFNANSASQSPKQIDKWFHPDRGKFAGFNLAIACGRKDGKGIVIADADQHGRGNGVAEWEELETSCPAPSHPWANTPNRGEHHVFQWHESFSKKSTKIDSSCGLEILGGKDGAFFLPYRGAVCRGGGCAGVRAKALRTRRLRPGHRLAVSHRGGAGSTGRRTGPRPRVDVTA